MLSNKNVSGLTCSQVKLDGTLIIQVVSVPPRIVASLSSMLAALTPFGKVLNPDRAMPARVKMKSFGKFMVSHRRFVLFKV